jgi:hypothetical protein
MGTDYRAMSRMGFNQTPDQYSNDNINTGCLQRIADATEKMAYNYTQMQKDLEWYKNAYKQSGQSYAKLEKRNAALKGVITKLKKKAKL